MLDEKAAAAQALGIYAAETRAAFAPHVEEALATLLAMANYFHDDVRRSTAPICCTSSRLGDRRMQSVRAQTRDAVRSLG